MLNRKNNSISLLILTLLTASCHRSSIVCGSKRHIALSHQAAFYHINLKWCDTLRLRGEKIYLDPVLKYRTTIGSNPEMQFDSERPSILTDQPFNCSFPLVIPDSISERYKYYVPSMNVKKDTLSFAFFSPLLPTKEKYIYALQYYAVGHYTDTVGVDVTLKFSLLHYNLFKVRHGKVKFLRVLDEPSEQYMW